ncbi:MAG TPA: hypothetical protein GX521_03610 [Firmicutes bacterium]|nr:hypothetical protein [Bacillota bacterium]
MKNPLEFAGKARYIGSLPRDGQLCDFYEVEIDGSTRYIYVSADGQKRPES